MHEHSVGKLYSEITPSGIPFYGNLKTDNEAAPYGEHCLEVCLKMILGVLEPAKEYRTEELETITAKGPGGTFATHYLMWMQRRGFEVTHVTSFDWEAFRDEGAAHYEKLGEGQLDFNSRSDLDHERSVIDEFLVTVPIIKRQPLVSDIKRSLAEGWLVRVSVDARVLDPDKDAYAGHSVVALDVEENNNRIVFHDPGLPAQAYRNESLETFQAAMDSFGGMMDLIRRSSNV